MLYHVRTRETRVAPNIRSRKSLLLLTHDRLDWTGRRPPAACSEEWPVCMPKLVRGRSTHHDNCFGARAACAHALTASAKPLAALLSEPDGVVACSFLAALDGNHARRSSRSVGRRVEYSHSAHGASWLALRQPRGCGSAGSALHACVRRHRDSECKERPSPTSQPSRRGRTMRGRWQSFSACCH